MPTTDFKVTRRETSALRHHADIDGLRAVAILGVLAYHFGLGGVTGGYGGVDVFFVISGFLIAGIISAGLKAGSFSIAQFYVRRIRRILPALTVCLLITTAFAALLLFPSDFKKFGRSLLMVALSVSNFHFQRLTGYFDGSALDKPLLHTWSLGVEEQFYLFFPLLLALLYKFRQRAAVPVLALVAVASLAYSAHDVQIRPESAFFSTAGRAWELLVGVLLALGVAPPIKRQLPREIEALICALLIAYGYFFYTAETDFPGLGAIPFCLGAALIIHAGIAAPPTAIARVLSSPPAVGIGLISYSVYLWHWPLLVLTRYRFPQAFTVEGYRLFTGVALLAASLLLGFLSWRLVEQPFRSGRWLQKQRVVFTSAAISTAMLAAVSLAVTEKGGWFQHWPSDVVATTSEADVSPTRCSPVPAASGWPGGSCLIGDGSKVPDTVLMGDSHAQALIPSFDAYGRQFGHRIIVVTYAGCPPLLGVRLYGRSRGTKCHHTLDQAAKKLATANVKRIVLTARWALYAEGLRGDDEGGATVHLTPGAVSENARVFAALLEKTVKQFAGRDREIVIIGPVPEQIVEITSAMARHRVWNEPLPAEITMQAFLERQRHVLPVLAQLAKLPHVRVLYPHSVFCSASVCRYSKDGKALYRDSNHLSEAGVAELSIIYPDVFNDRPLQTLAAH